MDNDGEILRLRKRCHDLEGTVSIMHELAVTTERRVGVVERDLRSLVDEDKIAKEVARRVNANRRVKLSWVQAVAVFVTVACSVGGLALGIIAAAGAHS